jgi:hypothetical protein
MLSTDAASRPALAELLPIYAPFVSLIGRAA